MPRDSYRKFSADPLESKYGPIEKMVFLRVASTRHGQVQSMRWEMSFLVKKKVFSDLISVVDELNEITVTAIPRRIHPIPSDLYVGLS